MCLTLNLKIHIHIVFLQNIKINPHIINIMKKITSICNIKQKIKTIINKYQKKYKTKL